MYFWTLPDDVLLGAVCDVDTSLTMGWMLGTVLVTGEVEVPEAVVLKVITCCVLLLADVEDITMNLVGGGEGCVGVEGRADTSVCTIGLMELGTLMMLGVRDEFWDCAPCASVRVCLGWVMVRVVRFTCCACIAAWARAFTT